MRNIIFILLFGISVTAQEQLQLKAPVVRPTLNSYSIRSLTIDKDNEIISVTIQANNSDRLVAYWAPDGLYVNGVLLNSKAPTGASLMKALNKANLSANSLEKRVLNQLVIDGAFVGTIVGNPE